METTTVTLPPPPYPEGGIPSILTTQQIVQSLQNNAPIKQYNNEDVEYHGNKNNEESDMDCQKKMVYKHPLFPLMALLFEKCEQATQTSDCPSSDSFDLDIQDFVRHQERDNKPFLVDNPEIDELMVKAIQVLRIHLLELEKVSDLCKDFCQRYISCLKGKLQNEQLLRIEGMDVSEHELGLQDTLLQAGQVAPATPTSPLNQIVSGNTVYQMVQTPQGLVAQPIRVSIPPVAPVVSTSPVQGSTPLSQIGVQQNSPTNTPPAMTVLSQPDDDDDKKSAAKRGILPKQATQIMKSWLFQHIVHPYPTEEEKKVLAGQTGLSILQINNWFINARRRILQPMLESTNPDGAKQKKTKPPQNRPQKYWPESLAQIPLQSRGDMESPLQGRGEAESEEESMQAQTTKGQEVMVEASALVTMADILQGMSNIGHTSNADVTSMINNVQQASSVLVAQNGQLDSHTGTIDSRQSTES